VPAPGWEAVADQLWPSWRHLSDLEERVAARFGPRLGEELLVLWAIWRFGSQGAEGDSVLRELVGDDMRPRFGIGCLGDMTEVAFALGAGWGREPETAAGSEGDPWRP
jgi:hypothetical protein